MATIDDVAKAAGVSKGTVSNVFSKKRPISKEVTDRVLAIAREMNYKPNYWARSLANKSTRIIGLNIRGESFRFSQFHLSLLNGVLHVCYQHGYRVLVNTLSPAYLEQVENIVTDPVDGEILLDPEVEDSRIEERLDSKIPIVLVGRPSKEYEAKVSYVDNDNVEAGAGVTRYLLSLGHRRILFLNAPSYRTVAEDRGYGFLSTLRKHGLRPDTSWVINKPDSVGSSFAFGYEMTKSVIAKNPEITAVIADTDSMALGVYKAAEEIGLNIPADLSVFAFSDNFRFSPEFTPPLTGTMLHAEELGMEAARMLIQLLSANAQTAKRTLISAKLVIRDSCASPSQKTEI